MLSSLLEQILGQPAWVVYVVVGTLVFVEDALFVGFVVPGETAAILGGVTAALGHTSLTWVAVIVVATAIIGDSVGYEVGRHLGPRLVELRPLRKARPRVEAAQAFLVRRGAASVFLARWTAFLRAVVPALAGSSRLPYPTFLLWNSIGGLAWGLTCVVGGYLAGRSYQRLESWLGTGALVVVGVVLLVAVGLHLRRRRADRAADAAGAAEVAGTSGTSEAPEASGRA
ncbi:DedA family protein [Phycicoccus sp. HDW14]|uniref:DedA family protein n=1 Tax=Phycicoccus sp. HDW14 TaxID=2714941 RepID=UPI00140C4848|nr:DedA family protein [Phycicoccus sp. HDW14]QIM22712.1 DedA family protein [Phycicoccus sp. HDW14]